ncbi:aminoglycoside phosphotransferase family protein [Micromonospora aurantiaca]|uniref:Phosphotransferase n=1 Tax=Micromonospora aurantiaca (nom. illeg.) TaxID=47850 RepID=A0A6N3KBP3_9ACTN|nr:aminoglycoside phosphotransferase family protein [Micromonospora aurantiaca]AXH93844.1 phosphotransferase [Micromonospora aurantiaca]
MALHQDEIPVDDQVVRALLAGQRPEWAALPLTPAGAGTDNTMYRLGADLLVRLPRTAEKAGALRKEQQWLPRLAPLLPYRVPEPVYAGVPADAFPLPWSVQRWIPGDEVRSGTVEDWAALGADLAAFVTRLHATDLLGATRAGPLSGYRGGSLRPCDAWISAALDDCRTRIGDETDVDTLDRLWRDALTLPEPDGPHVWLHGDLKPTNLLVHGGRLRAVIDFGGLTVGHPDAEHAPIWDLPPQARHAYREALGVDDVTWARARAWALGVAASGVSYYWATFPAFVAECRNRLREILADAG